MLTGGCYCGRIRYEAEHAPFHETVCHCGICRRISGAPMVGWFSVPIKGFRFTEGQPKEYRSSRHATRTFCPNCGSPLTCQFHAVSKEIDLTIGSLDEPQSIVPKEQVWVSKRLGWAVLQPPLPEHQKDRGSP